MTGRTGIVAVTLLMALALGLGARYAGAQSQWLAVLEQLNYGRSGQTATLLLDGRILVAGGGPTAGLSRQAEIYDPASATWSFTAELLVKPRRHHTATLLPDGRVLIVGGEDASQATELFDPVTNTFAETADALDTPRYYHTATLLPGGEVLVVGGYDDGAAPLTSCELFDPTDESWSPADSLSIARARHAATLLGSNDVLVSGGDGFGTSELYELATGEWRLTSGFMHHVRSAHTSTRLATGEVLVVGSSDVSGHLSAEVFDPDPAAETWSLTPTLPFSIEGGHSASLLADDRVLVCGGLSSDAPSGLWSGFCAIYDPAGGGGWSVADELSLARAFHTATMLPSGQVFVAGGSGLATDYLRHCELYTPATESLTGAAVMGAARAGLTATVLSDGRVLVAGGSGPSGPLNSFEAFDPGTQSWLTYSGHTLTTARTAHTATLLADGRVLVTGGTGSTGDLASAEVFDPQGNSWTATDLDMNVARSHHTATLLGDGRVLVAGGPGTAVTEVYDPDDDSWAVTTTGLSFTREQATATLLQDGRVLLVGGLAAGYSTELFNPSVGSWSSGGGLADYRYDHSATLLADGRVLVAGGHGNAATSAELYDPATNRWSPTRDSLVEPRWAHAAALLPDGRVLVAGGDSEAGKVASCEVYDPASDTWRQLGGGALTPARAGLKARVLADGDVLLIGGVPYLDEVDTPTNAVDLLQPAILAATDRPSITSVVADPPAVAKSLLQPLSGRSSKGSRRVVSDISTSAAPPPVVAVGTIQYGGELTVTGTDFSNGPEAGSGTTQTSAVNYPLVTLQGLSNDLRFHLLPDPLEEFTADEASLVFSQLPLGLYPGWYFLTVTQAGMPGVSVPVQVECNLVILTHPKSWEVAVGSSAIFEVSDIGGISYQWERCTTQDCLPQDWQLIPGADEPSYTTPAILGPESGSKYRAVISTGCMSEPTDAATLTVIDNEDPSAEVLSPSGGEYWLLSDSGGTARTELVTWSMADNIRICEVRVALLWAATSSGPWSEASGGGLPVVYGPGEPCLHPGVETTQTTYTVPTSPPSGSSGSLYKIQLEVTDHAGNTTTVTSANPFYIVQPNLGAVQTLVLTRPQAMAALFGSAEATLLQDKLYELAAHPLVQGVVVDLDPTSAGALLNQWSSGSVTANQALFGAGGLHEYLLQELLPAYSGVTQLVVVGDDRVIPFARMSDLTVLLPESTYTDGVNLTPTGSTVGEALAADAYLSDDPLAVLDPVAPDDLEAGDPDELSVFLPDLALGRLVETPAEIITTIATFISQDGVVDLTTTSHQTLITGYDFLLDTATMIRQRWKNRLGVSTPDSSTEPVDGALISSDWGLSSVAERRAALRTHLGGNGGDRYGVVSLNGHATHFEEGVPGTNPFDIQGLAAVDVYGPDGCASPSLGALDLAGSVVYAVGCHGGLAVPGSCATDADSSLDLPQTMLARGAMTYLANTGYGWGLKQGVGYGERLVQVFSEELTSGPEVVVGTAVKQAKLRYYLESARLDSYDLKTLMQWASYGLPMYSVHTGVAADKQAIPEQRERVAVTRSRDPSKSLPDYLTRLDLHFNLTAEGLYAKYDSLGQELSDDPGCPDSSGCYYTLNGLVTGMTDLPLQPYLVYESKLAGTSQHGVLWKGGTYLQEEGWVPVIGELTSNGGDGSNHGSMPRGVVIKPNSTQHIGGQNPDACRPSDLEVSKLVLTTGEALSPPGSATYTVERRLLEADLEVLYFNNSGDGQGNCDRQGPVLGPDPMSGRYHLVVGDTLEWSVQASDEAGVWRVVVVLNDGSVDGAGLGAWTPIELVEDGAGVWRGTLDVSQMTSLTYVVQAVDQRGNVSWLDYQTANLPASGVSFGLPLVLSPLEELLFADGFETGDASRWSGSSP